MVSYSLAFIFISIIVTDCVKCDQNNKTDTEIQSLKDEVQFLRERLGEVEGTLLKLHMDIAKDGNKREERFVGELDLEQEMSRLRQDVNQIKQGIASTYVRWGRTTCPGNTSLVYKGYMGGNAYTDKGGPANYVCLPEDPMWGKYQDGIQSHGNKMYGTEYELYGSFNPFDKQVHNEDAPCAVCRTQHETTLMIPARTDCYSGWQRQYTGYLLTIDTSHLAAGEYVCVDSSPEPIPHGSANENGNVLYVVEAVCGSLPCLPYVNGRELACVVCSK